MDPVTDISVNMNALKLSPSFIAQPSKTTATRALTWNEGTILSSYADFKGVDHEKDVKLLINIRGFKSVTDLFVVDESEKKSFFIVFTPFPPHYKNTDL